MLADITKRNIVIYSQDNLRYYEIYNPNEGADENTEAYELVRDD